MSMLLCKAIETIKLRVLGCQKLIKKLSFLGILAVLTLKTAKPVKLIANHQQKFQNKYSKAPKILNYSST